MAKVEVYTDGHGNVRTVSSEKPGVVKGILEKALAAYAQDEAAPKSGEDVTFPPVGDSVPAGPPADVPVVEEPPIPKAPEVPVKKNSRKKPKRSE